MSKHGREKVDKIVEALEGLEFGSVIITVHDGVIIQIDTTEKTRFSLKKRQVIK